MTITTTPPDQHDLTAVSALMQPGGAGRVNGASARSRHYYDDAGHRHRAAMEVPVDQYGKLVSALFRCPKGGPEENRWVPLTVASKGDPMCARHGRRMKRVSIKPTSVPWTTVRDRVVPQLWPVWIGLAVIAVGQAVHTSRVPAPMLAAAAVPAGLLAGFVLLVRWMRRARRAGSLDDPEKAERRRVQLHRRAQAVGRWVIVAMMWIAAAAAVGVDHRTFVGQVLLTVLVVVWLVPAATWWRWRRRLSAHRAAKADEPEPAAHMVIPMDPDEEQCRRIWTTIVAVRKDAVIGTDEAQRPIKAERVGRLVDTWLEDWHRIEGGWAATVVGPDGMYTAEKYQGARGAVASAYRMKTAQVTIIPDGDDENRAMILAQRTSPIGEVIRWAGPESIDPAKGTAVGGAFADGGPVPYELYRPGWGCPHVFTCGTTGAGKSELLSLLLAIDRWASYVDDETGERRGMVASFMIDPQQGQSFAPFLDDLAGPVASTLHEAKVLVDALLREMYRRNRYLAREAKTWDPKRNVWRAGRKWWNPLIDGPILSLTIDEAHLFLADREFCGMVTAAGRMWRKCGGQLRIGTHTPLLGDLGGSMALRDMLTGGFVAVFRTANSLSGHTAFNGRLAADPRQIPLIPGTMYCLAGETPRAMLARAAWEPDWYDWVRDLDDKPIGYPAPLPAETLAAFGPEYAAWVKHATSDTDAPFVPNQAPAQPEVPPRSVEAVRLALAASHGVVLDGEPIGPDGATVEQIDKILRSRGVTFSVRTIRDALAKLRKGGEATTDNGRHRLTDEAMAATLDQVAADA